MSFETAQKVIVPQKINYVPQFLKQRDINSYIVFACGVPFTFWQFAKRAQITFGSVAKGNRSPF
jgi:hypothetical protein